jgi:putative aminopeptidase FrvX
MLLKDLTEAIGVSGNEKSVRDIIIEKIKDYCDEINVDGMGNLYAVKRSDKLNTKRVMLAAHMDEVGMIVTGITEAGFIKFKPIGGIDPRILLSKRVVIGEKHIYGVIGIKAIHLQKPDERRQAVKLEDMYIDIGAKNKEDAEKMIKLGDYIGFDSKYKEFGDGLVKAKALDDRVGCAIIIDILKQRYDFELYGCFTVQEEVGLRGAQVASYRIEPDIALVIEGTTCSDVPETKEHQYSTVLGEGPALSIMDAKTYYDKNITKSLYETAVKNNIKVQYKKSIYGGNDAGKIHISRQGVPTASISVPCRYIHSSVSVMNKSDYEECKRLVSSWLRELTVN